MKEYQGENIITKNINKFEDNGYLSGLDGMRAIACLLIIFHHIFQKLNLEVSSGLIKEIQGFFLFSANTGTSIFFVLSGFLLSYPFWKRFFDNDILPSLKEYTIKRAARIIPGFYCAVFASVVVTLILKIDSQYLWQRTLFAVTFISGFNYITFFPSDVNGPLWSISLEVFWYILLPVFMIILFKICNKRSFIKALVYWLMVIFLVVIVNNYIHVYLTPNDINKGWQYGNIGGAKYWMPNYNPVALFGQFIIGIISSGITMQIYRLNNRFIKLKKYGFFDLLGCISFISSFILLWVLKYSPEFSFSIQKQPYFFPTFQVLIGITLISVSHSKIMGKIIDNKFLKYTSKVSFGLYIWHSIVITIVSYKWIPEYIYGGMYNINAWLLVSICVLVISYIIATISYYFIEKPVLYKIHKLF